MPRVPFRAAIKRDLASRAGYLCSICEGQTIGPSADNEEEFIRTGDACHIAGASEGGPRFNELPAGQERGGIGNGIWLCKEHASYVDSNECTYSYAALQVIKKNHERKISYRQSGIRTESGFVSSIEIENLGKMHSRTSVHFGNTNVILGDNAVGKSLILEMIASLSNKKYLRRWQKGKRDASSYCSIEFFRDRTDTFKFAFTPSRVVTYSFNGSVIPVMVPAMKVFYLQESYGSFVNALRPNQKEGKSVIELMAKYFDITKQEFVSVISSISQSRKYMLSSIELNESRTDLNVKMSPRSRVGRFEALSGGEKHRVILEVGLQLSCFYSKFTSTVVLVEGGAVGSIDSTGIRHLFKMLKEENLSFQLFYASVNESFKDIEGCNVITLIERKGEGVDVKHVVN